MNEFERQLLDTRDLPALSPSVPELLALMSDPAADRKRMAELVGSDGILSAVLWSPAFAGSEAMVSLREACTRLAVGTVCGAAVASAFVRALRREPHSETQDTVWRAALMKALAARQLAVATGAWSAPAAFLGGLMAQAGSLLLCERAPGYADLVERWRQGEDLLSLERAVLETDHAAMAPLLLEQLGFGAVHVDPIRSHFGALLAGGDLARRAQILNAADGLARVLTLSGHAGDVHALAGAVAETTGISHVRATALAAALPDALRQVAPAFGVPAGELPSWERLTGDVCTAAPSARETSGLDHVAALMAACRDFGSSSMEPQLATMYGPLASEHFAVALDVFHQRARQLRKPLSLLVLEVENLDTIAASLSADQLESAIQGLAGRISNIVRRTDPHARIERDQLAVLAPGCSRDDLPNLAARLQAGLEREPVETKAGPISLQLAIGMAGASPQDDGTDPNALLHSALGAVSRASTVPDRMFLAA